MKAQVGVALRSSGENTAFSGADAPFHRTIRGRLFLLVLAALAPLLLFLGFAVLESVRVSREDAAADALVYARLVSARVDEHVQHLDSLLLAVGALVGSNLDAVDANDARLRALQAGLPEYFSSISVLAPDGRMLNSSTAPRAERAGLNFADRSYFRDAVARRGFALGEPLVSRTSGKWILVSARPLFAADGTLRAVVSMSTLLERFQDMLVPATLPRGSLMTIVDERGTVVARSVDPHRWVGASLANDPGFQRAAHESEFGVETLASGGGARLAGYALPSSVPWVVHVEVPGGAAARGHAYLMRLPAFGLIALLIGAALAYLLSRQLSRPIEAIARGAREVAAGRLDARVTPTGPAELVSVGERINDMLEQIESVCVKLRDNETRLMLAMQAANLGLWDWDIARGRMYVSPAWKSQFGYGEEELSGPGDWPARLHPEDKPGAIARLKDCLEGRRPDYEAEFRLRHKDGSYRWVYTRAELMRDAEGKPSRMMGCQLDVTERRVASERERESSERLKRVLENMQDAFVALDRDWRYTYVNRKAARMFDRDPDALIGKHIWTEFPEGVGQPFHLAYERAMAEQQPAQIEEYYPPYGRWFENRILPTEEGLAIFFSDITERKRSEALLECQRQTLELIAVGSPLAKTLDALVRLIEEQRPGMLGSILLLDDDGVHLRHGAAPKLPESFTRLVDGEPIGERAGSCGTAAYRREAVVVEDIAADPLWEGYRELAAAHRLRACWSMPILDADGRVLGTFAMYFREPARPDERDLKLTGTATHLAAIAIAKSRTETELHRLVSRLRELSRRLLEVEEEERRRINREVHDRVSQNLSVLALSLNTVRGRLPAGALRAVGSPLDDACRLLEVTIMQVRDVMADLRPVALDDYGLLAALKSYAEPFSKRVGVRVDVDGDDLAPRLPAAVETAFFRIAQEALNNVAKHARAGKATVTLAADPARVALAVADDGVGFRPEESAKPRASWGLGTMRERAEAIGAALRIDSAPGRGTRVSVEIARAP